MKKRIKYFVYLILVIALCVSTMTGCGKKSGYRQTLNIIDSNLNFDFEFLTKADESTFVGYHAESGSVETDYISDTYWNEYLNYGEYVYYSVSPYPTYSSEDKYITKIYCSDPDITFFGVTLESDADAICKAFKNAGFDAEITTNNGITKVSSNLGNGITMGVYLKPNDKYFAIAAKVSESSQLIIDWR